MWVAIEHKFKSADMNDHRDHILGWMNDLWNKWRGHLHAKYVKDKPIQQPLKNAKSTRNATNRAKLKMLHHIGSKPGGKDDNPPDLTTILFETRKKDNKLVELEKIENMCAQLEEMVQAYPSLPTIEIVEKCCRPQTRIVAMYLDLEVE
ncbi:hypothetical protein KY285_016637 [Solanum tuberosum]|nr:hypothetical protein KY285_016637 [Solanum tuberosum]